MLEEVNYEIPLIITVLTVAFIFILLKNVHQGKH